MKASTLYTSFFIAVLITTGCDLIFDEAHEPSMRERHILKTYVLDISTGQCTFLVDGENPYQSEDNLVAEKMDIEVWHLVFAEDDNKIIYTAHKLEFYYE